MIGIKSEEAISGLEMAFSCKLAVWTGLEPATSAVTGRHSNQLNYQTVCFGGEAVCFSALVMLRSKELKSYFAGRKLISVPEDIETEKKK